MASKPSTASGYSPEQTELVRRCGLYVATILGDLMNDVVIIGGFVPHLLVNQSEISDAADRHPGTMDLDLGLRMAVLDEEKYRELTQRLREAGFSQDDNGQGRPTNQRWKISTKAGKVTVDFLIESTSGTGKAGGLLNIEKDFAAIITPGLHIAFQDRKEIKLTGLTILEEKATRNIWVCGPGAFIVLKALSFRNRGVNKDAYDLYYVARYYGTGLPDVIAALKPLLKEAETKDALAVLKADFLDHEGIGPKRVAMFLTGGSDDEIQADVVGVVQQIVEGCE